MFVERRSALREDPARKHAAAAMRQLFPVVPKLALTADDIAVCDISDHTKNIWHQAMRKLSQVYHNIDVPEIDHIPSEVLRSTLTACAVAADGEAMLYVDQLACLREPQNRPLIEVRSVKQEPQSRSLMTVGNVRQACDGVRTTAALHLEAIHRSKPCLMSAREAANLVALLARYCEDIVIPANDQDEVLEQRKVVGMMETALTAHPNNAFWVKKLARERECLSRLEAPAQRASLSRLDARTLARPKVGFCNAGIDMDHAMRESKLEAVETANNLEQMQHDELIGQTSPYGK